MIRIAWITKNKMLTATIKSMQCCVGTYFAFLLAPINQNSYSFTKFTNTVFLCMLRGMLPTKICCQALRNIVWQLSSARWDALVSFVCLSLWPITSHLRIIIFLLSNFNFPATFYIYIPVYCHATSENSLLTSLAFLSSVNKTTKTNMVSKYYHWSRCLFSSTIQRCKY